MGLRMKPEHESPAGDKKEYYDYCPNCGKEWKEHNDNKCINILVDKWRKAVTEGDKQLAEATKEISKLKDTILTAHRRGLESGYKDGKKDQRIKSDKALEDLEDFVKAQYGYTNNPYKLITRIKEEIQRIRGSLE